MKLMFKSATLLAFVLSSVMSAATPEATSNEGLVPVTYAFKNIALSDAMFETIKGNIGKITDKEPAFLECIRDANSIFTLVDSTAKGFVEEYLRGIDVFPGQSDYKILDEKGRSTRFVSLDGREIVFSNGENISVMGHPVFVGTKISLNSKGGLTSYDILVRRIIGHKQIEGHNMPILEEFSTAGSFFGKSATVGGLPPSKTGTLTIERTALDVDGKPVAL